MFLRRCLLAALIATVPAFSAIGDTQGLPRRAAGFGAGVVRDIRGASRDIAVPEQFGTPRVRRGATGDGAIRDTHDLLRHAAKPVAGTSASFASGSGAMKRFDTRHGALPAGDDHTARSAEISQSVIRNAAVGAALGFGIRQLGTGEKRTPETHSGLSSAPA